MIKLFYTICLLKNEYNTARYTNYFVVVSHIYDFSSSIWHCLPITSVYENLPLDTAKVHNYFHPLRYNYPHKLFILCADLHFFASCANINTICKSIRQDKQNAEICLQQENRKERVTCNEVSVCQWQVDDNSEKSM